MHVSTVAAAALLTLAAATPSNAQAQGAPYRAVGTEPFWSLTIDRATMRFEAPGNRPVTVPTPKVIHGFAGEIYKTPRLNVNIVHKSCSDGMSDRTYRDTVQVTVGRRTYQGCGGETIAQASTPSPILGEWRVQSIAGRPPVPGTNVTVTFKEGRVSGNTGCNAFGGSYRFERGTLIAGPLISTKRACLRGIGTQEQDLLGLLGQRLSVSQNRGGKLVLTARGGRTLVLAPVRGGY
jgi:uncharacterized membrane protein